MLARIQLLVTTNVPTKLVDFMVINIPFSYNIILGRKELLKQSILNESKDKGSMKKLQKIQINPNKLERELWIRTKLNDEQKNLLTQFLQECQSNFAWWTEDLTCILDTKITNKLNINPTCPTNQAENEEIFAWS